MLDDDLEYMRVANMERADHKDQARKLLDRARSAAFFHQYDAAAAFAALATAHYAAAQAGQSPQHP